MADESITRAEQTTAVTPATVVQTTATEPVQTPVAAAEQQQSVNIDEIEARAAEKATTQAEKKAEAVFKSMLQQSGLDMETINKMTAEWKSKQQTPEQALAERDRQIEALQAQLAERDRAAAIKAAKDEIAATLRAENLNPDAINLILTFFPEGKAKVEDGAVTNKDEIIETIRKSSPGLFGKVETRSADVATPPTNNPVPAAPKTLSEALHQKYEKKD